MELIWAISHSVVALPHWLFPFPVSRLNTINLGLILMLANRDSFPHLQIFGDYYDFHHQRLKKRSAEPAVHHQGRLDKDHRVREAIQQVAKRRQKRDYQRTWKYELNDPRWQQMWYLVSISSKKVSTAHERREN